VADLDVQGKLRAGVQTVQIAVPSQLKPESSGVALTRILLPIDFNYSNLRAAHQVRVLARRFHASVTLMHVAEDSSFAFYAPAAGAELNASRTRLERFGAAELPGITVKPVITSGDPATRIVEFAESQHCHLIVMPTHGYGPVRRFLLGLVTAKVLNKATCPVWTVASSTWESSASGLKHVVCGVNFNSSTATIVRWAALFAQAFGAKLSVLSVLPSRSPCDGRERYVDQRNEGVLSVLESKLSGLVRELGVHAEILVDEGDAATILLDVARVKEAGLLAIGRRDGGCDGLNDDANAVVRHAPCPVVSV